ncbi:MAG: HAD family hydrolase, partial [Candidatus Asgardarchaeia archaeon]
EKVNKIMEDVEMESLDDVQEEDCLEELLKSISEYEVYLVTMQSSRYARTILERFGVVKYFRGIYGREVTKNYLREEQLRHVGVKEGDILVGDMKLDVIAAKRFGMIPIGVGRNKLRRVLLKNYGALFVVKDLCELKEVLMKVISSSEKPSQQT